MDDNDVIDRLVAAADPLTAAPAEMPPVNEALERLAAGITSTSVSVAGRRRRWITAGVAATAVVALGAPAAADWISARTGWFGDPGLTEEDGSEWLRLDSPEISQVVAEQVRQLSLTLPAGVTTGDVVGAVTSRLANNDDLAPALMQETGVRNTVGWDVACRWGWRWLDTVGVDRAAAAAARTAMVEAARRTDALPSALDRNDATLAQEIRANCPPAADR